MWIPALSLSLSLSLSLPLFFATLTSQQTGQPADRPQAVPLWPDGAPGKKGDQPEDIPTLSVYRAPEGKSSGAAIIVCPGGGYARLADHEGHNVAVWLNSIGVTAVVLKYRLGPRYNHPAMLQDALRAIASVRARANELKLDPKKIGIMGFSAGGHLASTAATHFEDGDPASTDALKRAGSRPDLLILGYPVVTMTESWVHAGSRQNLLGANPSKEMLDLLSNEKQVTPRTPPTFIFHTQDDAGVPVENSLAFAAALRRAKVPYEMHAYEHGRHGVGLADADPVLSTWPKLLENWLRAHGFVNQVSN